LILLYTIVIPNNNNNIYKKYSSLYFKITLLFITIVLGLRLRLFILNLLYFIISRVFNWKVWIFIILYLQLIQCTPRGLFVLYFVPRNNTIITKCIVMGIFDFVLWRAVGSCYHERLVIEFSRYHTWFKKNLKSKKALNIL